MAGLGNGWWERVQEPLIEASTKFLAKFARKRLDGMYRAIALRNVHQLTVIAAAVSCWLAVGFGIYGQEAVSGQNITDSGIITKGEAWIITPWTSDNEKLFYEIKRQEAWHMLGAVFSVCGGLLAGMTFVALFLRLYTGRVICNFDRLLALLAPKMSPEAILAYRARFAAMSSYADYERLWRELTDLKGQYDGLKAE